LNIINSYFVLQKLREQRELEHRKREEEETEEIKQREGLEKSTPPVRSPEEKKMTVPGTSVVVMPAITTDNVIYPDMLEPERPAYVPKPDSLSVSAPR
jgi:hypothetical protein